MGKRRGRPGITVRLAPEIIAALKICANRHGLSLSDLLRDMIVQQLQADGISVADQPLDGQLSM